MAICKNCGHEFEWGQTEDGRWIPLEPKESDSDLRKTYVDPWGVFRADHRERCSGVPILVTRLKKPVPAEQVNPQPEKKKGLFGRKLQDATEH